MSGVVGSKCFCFKRSSLLTMDFIEKKKKVDHQQQSSHESRAGWYRPKTNKKSISSFKIQHLNMSVFLLDHVFFNLWNKGGLQVKASCQISRRLLPETPAAQYSHPFAPRFFQKCLSSAAHVTLWIRITSTSVERHLPLRSLALHRQLVARLCLPPCVRHHAPGPLSLRVSEWGQGGFPPRCAPRGRQWRGKVVSRDGHVRRNEEPATVHSMQNQLRG